jgi:hypothetical protein
VHQLLLQHGGSSFKDIEVGSLLGLGKAQGAKVLGAKVE